MAPSISVIARSEGAQTRATRQSRLSIINHFSPRGARGTTGKDKTIEPQRVIDPRRKGRKGRRKTRNKKPESRITRMTTNCTNGFVGAHGGAPRIGNKKPGTRDQIFCHKAHGVLRGKDRKKPELISLATKLHEKHEKTSSPRGARGITGKNRASEPQIHADYNRSRMSCRCGFIRNLWAFVGAPACCALSVIPGLTGNPCRGTARRAQNHLRPSA